MENKQQFHLCTIISGFILLISTLSYSQTTPGEFKLALVQMYVEPGKLEQNLNHAEDLIREAAANKADVILLPEVMDLGWTHPSARQLAGQIPEGNTCKRICKAA